MKSSKELEIELEAARKRERAEREAAALAKAKAERVECIAALVAHGLRVTLDPEEEWFCDDIAEVHWGSTGELAIDIDYRSEDRRVSGYGDPTVRWYTPQGKLLERVATEDWIGGDSGPSCAAFLTACVLRLASRMTPPRATVPGFEAVPTSSFKWPDAPRKDAEKFESPSVGLTTSFWVD